MTDRMRSYDVYIQHNPNRSLYTGDTNNIERRMYEHESERGSARVTRYTITELVFVEEFTHIIDAIALEKELKGWLRLRHPTQGGSI